jgi:glucan-binding YG repeat protein
MNKNIKRIVALALVLGTVSAVAPTTNFNLLITKAYASDENSRTTLDSLKLKTSSDSTIQLYDSDNYKSGDKVDNDEIKDDGEYYAKTSSKKISISTSGPNTKYIKVFKGTNSSTKGKSITSDIDLSSGSTVLTVKVYNNKPDSDVRYDDGDVASSYEIRVKYTGSSDGSDSSTSSTDASDYDSIYLDKLTVDGESISLSDSKVAYSYNIANSSTSAIIKALPADEDNDEVTIAGTTVDSSDNFKKTVSLNVGDNKFEVETYNSDDNDRRIYTLNIIRAAAAATVNTATTQSTAATAVVNTAIKASQWVQVNGQWQYNDALGNPIKNSWCKNYYLLDTGYMATNWASIGGKWYFFGTDGAMKTGWIIDGGKYYYLNSDGSMASSTTISGYKLGSDGAWIR